MGELSLYEDVTRVIVKNQNLSKSKKLVGHEVV